MSEWTVVALDDDGNEVSDRVTLEPAPGDAPWRLVDPMVVASPTGAHVIRVEGEGRTFILPLGARTHESLLVTHVAGIPVEVVDYSILEA